MYFTKETAKKLLRLSNEDFFDEFTPTLNDFFIKKTIQATNITEEHFYNICNNYFWPNVNGEARVIYPDGTRPSLYGSQNTEVALAENDNVEKPEKKITNEDDRKLYERIEEDLAISDRINDSFDSADGNHKPDDLLEALEDYADFIIEITNNKEVIFEIQTLINGFLTEKEGRDGLPEAKVIKLPPKSRK